jgi:hypothetical protein
MNAGVDVKPAVAAFIDSVTQDERRSASWAPGKAFAASQLSNALQVGFQRGPQALD